jgi:hypothetical protein
MFSMWMFVGFSLTVSSSQFCGKTEKLGANMRLTQLAVIAFTATVLSVSAQSTMNVFPFGDLWRYQDTGPISSSILWYAPEFDDSTWKTGYGSFGAGMTAFTTMATTNNSVFIRAYYFRKVQIFA